jgi:hypothetical protein
VAPAQAATRAEAREQKLRSEVTPWHMLSSYADCTLCEGDGKHSPVYLATYVDKFETAGQDDALDKLSRTTLLARL